MNAVVKKQIMDWSKRSAHQWLEQYGLWVRSVKFNVTANPLAILIDQNDKSRVRASRVSMVCEINDFEAVQVSKLLASMHNDSREYLASRAWYLILYYENEWSYLSIAIAHKCSKATIRAEIDKGLAYLDGKIDMLQS